MKKIIQFILAVFVLAGLTGCFEINTLVKLKPDGSGTIEETFLMSKELVNQMNEMSKQMSAVGEGGGKAGKKKGKKQEKDTFGMFNAEELKKKAGDMGEGVTYVSSKKITTNTAEGYKAIYSFKDINKVRFNQNPGGKMSSGPAGGGQEEKKEFVSFQFVAGNPSSLKIMMPESKSVDELKAAKEEVNKAQPDDPQTEMMMAQMKEMFKGMKMGFDIEIIGNIVQTNATHRNGNRITIMELDFGRLIETPEEFRKFSQVNPKTVEDAKQLMKDVPGIKVELNKEVTIDFK